MRIIIYLGFLIIFVVTLIFSVLNFHTIEIHLYFATITLPLAVALTIELFVGIAIGVLAASLHIVKLKSRYVELNKKLSKAGSRPDSGSAGRE